MKMEDGPFHILMNQSPWPIFLFHLYGGLS